MKLGNLAVRELHLGNFRLDGGAMFGIVPKVLWEKKNQADSFNRIDLALRCLLIEGPNFKCLIDTGMGQKWSPQQREIWGMQNAVDAVSGLHTVSDISASDITHVILTHLHFDHAGGLTYLDAQGKIQKTFPNATVILQETNLATAENPNPRERASYKSENWEAYKKSGQIHLIKIKSLDLCEVLPGIQVFRSDGHTLGQQMVLLGQEAGERILYCGDLVPTSSHLPLAWTMGYDVDPLLLMKERKVVLDWALEQGWMLCFEHDPKISLARLGRVERRHGGFDFEFSEDLSEKFRTLT